MSNAGKKIIAAATEALAVARGEEPAASITVNGHTYVSAERVRTLEAELSKAREALEGAANASDKIADAMISSLGIAVVRKSDKAKISAAAAAAIRSLSKKEG